MQATNFTTDESSEPMRSPLPVGGQTILLLCDDLMTTSRVREATRSLGCPLHVAATTDAALAFIRAQDPSAAAVLMSLTMRRGGTEEALRFLRTLRGDDEPTIASLPCAAFAGHVEREKHEQARAAGATLVVANSTIALHLNTILSRLFSHAPQTSQTPNGSGEEENLLLEFGDETKDASSA